MKAFWGLVVCLTIGVTHPARADSNACFTSTLRSSPGAYVTLNTGGVYVITPGGGRTTVQTWLPLDKIQVCHATGSAWALTNLSRKPTKTVTALQRN